MSVPTPWWARYFSWAILCCNAKRKATRAGWVVNAADKPAKEREMQVDKKGQMRYKTAVNNLVILDVDSSDAGYAR